jgi:predicted TIM-barrel fold metal-dependent hydrolase
MTTTTETPPKPVSPVLAPAKVDEYNRTGIDFRQPMPRPKVRGITIDFHCHLFAARHAKAWFEAADHYGIDCFVTMTPLEEAAGLLRDYPDRIRFNVVPKWQEFSPDWIDDWLRRLESFYNLGSRIVKFHASPGTLDMRKLPLDSPKLKPIFRAIVDRRMAIMTHVGDPDTWYNGRYADTARYGTREQHYRMLEDAMREHFDVPWVGAHMSGNPEDLARIQDLLDRFPNFMIDCSATRWMQREISARRDAAREFFIRNQDRILFGTDQVSGDDRGFDFLASRFWVHRKLWDTAYVGPSPIIDPDLPADQQPFIRGLALPDEVLQKIYHDNATKFLARIGMSFEPVEH